MTLRHIVLFHFNDQVTQDEIASLARGLSALPKTISEIRAYRHGPDARVSDTSWDYALVADFDSVEAFEAYRAHPLHQQLIVERITPIVAERVAVQLLLPEIETGAAP